MTGPGETRKVVTVVFADLAGSTALAERLDPEALRQVMALYFERMSAVLEQHGGMVEKFIGDAVMAVFGIPTLHEDDALRAVRAAAEMRAALARAERRARARGGACGSRSGPASTRARSSPAIPSSGHGVPGRRRRQRRRAARAGRRAGRDPDRRADLRRRARRGRGAEQTEPRSAEGQGRAGAAYRLLEVVAGAPLRRAPARLAAGRAGGGAARGSRRRSSERERTRELRARDRPRRTRASASRG